MDQNNDTLLIHRCRDGDRAAWCELVRRYDRFVFSVAISTGVGTEDAEDVTQTTFSALLESIDRLQPDSRLAPWLATVARRQAWRIQARNARERTGGNDDIAWTVAESQADENREFHLWERLHGMTLALDRLDPRCRQLITALYFDTDQPTYEDIARRFDMPLGSIGPTRARCLERLRGILDTLEPEQG